MDSAASLISFSSEHSTSIWLAKKPNYERESEEQEYFDRCSTELMMDADTSRDGLDNRATLSKQIIIPGMTVCILQVQILIGSETQDTA